MAGEIGGAAAECGGDGGYACFLDEDEYCCGLENGEGLGQRGCGSGVEGEAENGDWELEEHTPQVGTAETAALQAVWAEATVRPLRARARLRSFIL